MYTNSWSEAANKKLWIYLLEGNVFFSTSSRTLKMKWGIKKYLKVNLLKAEITIELVKKIVVPIPTHTVGDEFDLFRKMRIF